MSLWAQAQFFVDDDGDTVDESHYASNNHPLIHPNHAEEADDALKQAQAIAWRYASHHEINLPEGEFENDGEP